MRTASRWLLSIAASASLIAGLPGVARAADTGDRLALSGDDRLVVNTKGMRDFTNGDLSVLPDNINWTTPRTDAPLNGLAAHEGNPAIEQPGPAVIYSPVQQHQYEGFTLPLPTNNAAFGWQLNGNVAFSNTGEAIARGTGRDGIVNSVGQKNVVWLGNHTAAGEESQGFSARDFVDNAADMPEGTTFEFASGWFKPAADGGWSWEEGTEGEAGAVRYDLPDTSVYRVQKILVKITFPDSSVGYLPSTLTARARWNNGMFQDIDVIPGSEIVITPSWVSNGRTLSVTDGTFEDTDQVKVELYDASDQDVIDSFAAYGTPAFTARPLATLETSTGAGTQGLPFDVPPTVGKLRVVVLPQTPEASHTGLPAGAKDELMTGLTGMSVSTGSHIAVELADPGAVHAVGEAFDWSFDIVNDGHADAAIEMPLICPEGVTVESTEVTTEADSYVADGAMQDGTGRYGALVYIDHLAPSARATVTLKGVRGSSEGFKAFDASSALTYTTQGAFDRDKDGSPQNSLGAKRVFKLDAGMSFVSAPAGGKQDAVDQDSDQSGQGNPSPEKARRKVALKRKLPKTGDPALIAVALTLASAGGALSLAWLRRRSR